MDSDLSVFNEGKQKYARGGSAAQKERRYELIKSQIFAFFSLYLPFFILLRRRRFLKFSMVDELIQLFFIHLEF